LIVPFFLLLKRQLSIEAAVAHLIASYQRARKRGGRPDQIMSHLNHVTEYGVAAASERDLKAYSSVIAGLVAVALANDATFAADQLAGLLTALTTVIGPAEGDPILSAVALRTIGERLHSSDGLNGSQGVGAQIVSRLIRPLLISLLQKGLNDDHTTDGPIHYGIELLSAIGRRASALGASTTAAASVSVLAELKFNAPELVQLTVAGRSARALARIGRPGRQALREHLPKGEAQLRSGDNLLLNGGFEFGHDAGYGREPGWFNALYSRELDSRALPDESKSSTRDWTLRLRSSVEGASFAQDVVPLQGIAPGDSFILLGRLATDDPPGLARLALWALGGIEERGVTNVRLVDNLSNVLGCQFDVRFAGHHGLRVELYLDTARANYHLDDVFLVRSLARNGGFELGSLDYWQIAGSCDVREDNSTPPWLGGEFVALLESDACIEQVLDLTGAAFVQMDHVMVTFVTRSDDHGARISIVVSTSESSTSAWAYPTSQWCRTVRILPMPPGSSAVTLTFRARARVLIDAITVVAIKDSPRDGWNVLPSSVTETRKKKIQTVTPRRYGVSSWLISPSDSLEVQRIVGSSVEPGLSFSIVAMARLRLGSASSSDDVGEVVTASLVARDRNGTVLNSRSRSVALKDSSWQLIWITFDVDNWDCWDVVAQITCFSLSRKVEITIPASLPLIDTCGAPYGAALRTGDRG
jgi:hypothetical protein